MMTRIELDAFNAQISMARSLARIAHCLEKKPIDNDDTRDIALVCVERAVKATLIQDCTDTEKTDEFDLQDIIHDEINKALGIKAD